MPSPFPSRLLRIFSTPSTLSVAPLTSSGAGAPVASAISSMTVPDGAEVATFAAGCFWGVEKMFRRKFGAEKGQERGLIDARVGYIGGHVAEPSYQAVCSGETGHAEAVQIVFNPHIVPYAHLVQYFYRIHEPDTLNRQGPDRGPQYRSAIFYHSAEQERVARRVTERVREKWRKNLVTEIVLAGQWWDAEEYHQRYLLKNPSGYDCPTHLERTELPELDLSDV